MPSDSQPRSPLRSLPWGLLGMVALVVAVEGFAKRHERDLFLKVDAWTWEQTKRRAEGDGRQAQVVCLGDSLVQVGVAAPVVETVTGKTTCNLAISGGQAASSYFLLRRLLDAGGRPDALVLDLFPRHLQTSPLEGLDPWVDLARPADVVDLARTGRDGEALGRIALAKLVPTVRARPEIRASVYAAWHGVDQTDRRHVPPFLRRNLKVNHGGLLCPAPTELKNDLEAWSRKYFPGDWTCHPTHEVYLQRLLTLAETRRIPVFWLLPPMLPEMQQRCEQSGFDARHLEFVRSYQARYANVTVLDGRHAQYESHLFFDPHHLARDGAAVFSADVAQAVRRTLDVDATEATASARTRWVELPRYRKRRIDGPLEDVEQSRTAMKHNGPERLR